MIFNLALNFRPGIRGKIVATKNPYRREGTVELPLMK
jgi:hypothetical protein